MTPESNPLPAWLGELEATRPSNGHFTDTCPLDRRFTAIYIGHSLIAMAETSKKAANLVTQLNALPALIAHIRQQAQEIEGLKEAAKKRAKFDVEYDEELAKRIGIRELQEIYHEVQNRV